MLHLYNPLTFYTLVLTSVARSDNEMWNLLCKSFDMESFKNYDFIVDFLSNGIADPTISYQQSLLCDSLASNTMMVTYHDSIADYVTNWIPQSVNNTHLMIAWFFKGLSSLATIVLNAKHSTIHFIIATSNGSMENYWKTQACNKYAPCSFADDKIDCELYEYSTTNAQTLKKHLDIIGDRFQAEDILKWTSTQRQFIGNSIKAAAILGETYVTHKGENESLEFTGGFSYEIFKYLADSYNLTMIAVDGIQYASTTVLPRDSNVTDIGTKIINGEVDIAISTHEYHVNRAVQLSYLQPTASERLWSYFIQPPASSIRNIFVQAFQKYLWIALISMWCFTVIVVFTLLKLKECVADAEENGNYEYGILCLLSIVCQQGCYIKSESVSMKCVLVTSLVTNLIIYLAYSAALVSILAVAVTPIKGLADLKNEKFLFRVDTSVASAVLEGINESNSGVYNDKDSGIQAIINSRSVFVSTDEEIYLSLQRYFLDQYICSTISKIPISAFPVKAGMLVGKNSPLREFFNLKILSMYSNGIFNRHRMAQLRLVSVSCLKKKGNRNKDLGLKDLLTAFVMLVALYVASVLILVLEIFLHSRQKLITKYCS